MFSVLVEFFQLYVSLLHDIAYPAIFIGIGVGIGVFVAQMPELQKPEDPTDHS